MFIIFILFIYYRSFDYPHKTYHLIILLIPIASIGVQSFPKLDKYSNEFHQSLEDIRSYPPIEMTFNYGPQSSLSMPTLFKPSGSSQLNLRPETPSYFSDTDAEFPKITSKLTRGESDFKPLEPVVPNWTAKPFRRSSDPRMDYYRFD